MALVHHSASGNNYILLAYPEALITDGVRAWVGTVCDSYDNALAEAISSLYKAELIHRRRTTALEIAVLDWVTWWNRKRLHEALDYRNLEASYALDPQ